MFSRGGGAVAAAAPKQPAPAGSATPSAWGMYVTVEDIGATIGLVEAAGGAVLMPPLEVMTAGVMGVIQDPLGTIISLWQAGDHIGAELVNEANAVAWHEYTCRDIPAVAGFYAAVFGWEIRPMDENEPGGYRLVQLGARTVAGMLPMDGEDWGDMPSHWMTYFAVDDCDATALRAAELGGTVGVEPTDLPIGRFAVIADPEGAHFSVMAFSGPLDDIPDGVA